MQGGEYQNFLLNKKFFIPLFFCSYVQIQLQQNVCLYFFKRICAALIFNISYNMPVPQSVLRFEWFSTTNELQ